MAEDFKNAFVPTLNDVLEWLKSDGWIDDVHYDKESVIAQIEAVLAGS